jgi:hypothetical protein
MKKRFQLLLVLTFLAFLALPCTCIANNQVRTASVSTPKASTLTETLGAFIIIAGQRSDMALQNVIVAGADQVYNILVHHLGFPASRVYYLCPVATDPYANGTSTYANIAYAFSTWAVGKVDAAHGLGLYLFDHGNTNIMGIVGGVLYSTDLDSFLNSLRVATNCSRDIIVYEACESGSFINALSAPDRIIITSTDATHSAYASATWAIFSESFWGSIAAGGTIGSAFVAGCRNVMACGDGYAQYPLLEDDNDGVGTGPLWVSFPPTPWVTLPPYPIFPWGDDGYDASSTYIHGYNPFSFILLAQILSTARDIVVNQTANIPVWARVNSSSMVSSVWARLTPAYWSPPNPPNPPDVNGLSELVVDNGTQLIQLTDPNGSGNYTGSFSPGGVVGKSSWPIGQYRITIFPNGTDGVIGNVVTSMATVTQNGSLPKGSTPPVVMIVNPLANSTLNGAANIVTFGDDAVGLKSVAIFVDGKQVANENYSTYPYPSLTASINTTKYSNGPHQITAVATNIAGLTANESITVTINNPTTNYTTVVDLVIFGIGFFVGAALIGLLRGGKKRGGGAGITDGSSTSSASRGATFTKIPAVQGEKPLKYVNEKKPLEYGGEKQMKYVKGEAGQEKWIKLQDKWIKDASPNSADGSVIKPLKAVVRPNTGKSVKLPKGNAKDIKLDGMDGE